MKIFSMVRNGFNAVNVFITNIHNRRRISLKILLDIKVDVRVIDAKVHNSRMLHYISIIGSFCPLVDMTVEETVAYSL
jgi:hypothetical protein